MNSKEIFALALGDLGAWELKKIRFEADEKGTKTLHLELDFPPGSEFLNAGGELCKAHDTSNHTWRHLNFFEHQCYLHARVPRIKNKAGEVKTIIVPWASKNSGFTLLLEAFMMSLIECEMPVSSVAKLIGELDQRVWNVFHRYVRQARKQADYSGITKIGVDETSSKRGHNYVTIGVDLEKRRVFEAVKGKDAATIAALSVFLEDHGSPFDEVAQVSIDMSPAFIAGTNQFWPNADLTFDRFHVNQVVQKALDELRKTERADCKGLKGIKYTLLKNPENLKETAKKNLQSVITLYPKIGEGYRLKELLREFWQFDDSEKAERFLQDWCDQAQNSAIIPFQKAANTLKNHWDGILNYVKSKISNGILEGINSKVQLAKRRARGYRNIDNFISMILFIAGKLDFSIPPM